MRTENETHKSRSLAVAALTAAFKDDNLESVEVFKDADGNFCTSFTLADGKKNNKPVLPARARSASKAKSKSKK